MSLATPERIRSLQRKLYCKAKAEPAFRFYMLYDKICRADILAHAYEVARARYERGVSNYLDVTDAQRSALSAERDAAQIATARLLAAVAVARSLGGGWTSSAAL